MQSKGQMSTLYANLFSRTLCNSALDWRPSGKNNYLALSYKDIGIEVSLMIPRRDIPKDISLQNLNSLPNCGSNRELYWQLQTKNFVWSSGPVIWWRSAATICTRHVGWRRLQRDAILSMSGASAGPGPISMRRSTEPSRLDFHDKQFNETFDTNFA
jgi:hypothetical protein